jgi:lipid II:glycine glycyltransferase (peptidoglycan interpeptide bridge formation enzyme)
MTTTASRDVAALRADPAAWDAFVEASVTDYPLQLSAWAEAKAATGWRSVRVVADGGSGPIGGQLLVHRLGPGPFAVGYLPRGPIATSFDRRSVEAFTSALRDMARAQRLTHVTADPGLEGDAHHASLRAAGWRPSTPMQPTSSQLIDLSRSEAELWSDVYKSSRRYANGARKAGCTVREGDESDLPVFHEIVVQTARRSGFIPRALEAYRDVYRAFAKGGRAHLLIGSLPDGRPVSSKLILVCGGRAAQLYGGLTDAGWEARAGHFFEWQAIIASREAGASVFDMWGRSTGGIAHFKQGFGGRVVEYGGTFDLVVNPRVHAIFQRARAVSVRLARRRRGLDGGEGAGHARAGEASAPVAEATDQAAPAAAPSAQAAGPAGTADEP